MLHKCLSTQVDSRGELSSLCIIFLQFCLSFPFCLFIPSVRLKTVASMDACQRYKNSWGHNESQFSLNLQLMLSLWTYHRDGGLVCSLIWIGTGEGMLGDELQMLLWIIHPLEQLFLPSWNSFPSGCTWQCRNLSPSYRQFSFVPKVQLSLLQLFRRFSVKSEPASVSSSQQPPSSSGSGWRIDPHC